MKRLVLALIAAVLLLGWTGPSYAGGGGHGRGHGGGHHGGGHHGGGHYGGSHHGGHHGGHYYDDYHFLLHGAPYLLSWLPFWNYPARAVATAPATEYIQQTNYWYYCTDPQGYHPYVEDCPTGWLQVVPKSSPR